MESNSNHSLVSWADNVLITCCKMSQHQTPSPTPKQRAHETGNYFHSPSFFHKNESHLNPTEKKQNLKKEQIASSDPIVVEEPAASAGTSCSSESGVLGVGRKQKLCMARWTKLQESTDLHQCGSPDVGSPLYHIPRHLLDQTSVDHSKNLRNTRSWRFTMPPPSVVASHREFKSSSAQLCALKDDMRLLSAAEAQATVIISPITVSLWLPHAHHDRRTAALASQSRCCD